MANKYIVSLNGKDYEVEVERGEAILVSVTDTPVAAPAAPAAAPVAAPAAAPAAPAAPAAVSGGDPVVAPMPGTILSVKVSAGSAVKAGDVMIVLEAMKMENDIVAPRDGTVAQVLATQGSTVDTGATLVVLN